MTESDRTPRIPLQNMAAACLFQHQHPTVLSGKGRISQAQRKKSFSSWFMARGGPGTRCRLETVLSPVLLGGGGGVKWPQRVPFSCPQTECNRVPRCLESQLRPRLCEASLKPQKGGSSPSSAPSWGLFLLTFQDRPAWLEMWDH